MYKSEYGVFNQCYPQYPVSELERYSSHSSYILEGSNDDKWLSLREAAKLQDPWNRFVDNNCTCKTGCSTMRCRCFKRGLSCSTHCHSGKACSNQKHDHKTTDLQMYSKTGQQKRKYAEVI